MPSGKSPRRTWMTAVLSSGTRTEKWRRWKKGTRCVCDGAGHHSMGSADCRGQCNSMLPLIRISGGGGAGVGVRARGLLCGWHRALLATGMEAWACCQLDCSLGMLHLSTRIGRKDTNSWQGQWQVAHVANTPLSLCPCGRPAQCLCTDCTTVHDGSCRRMGPRTGSGSQSYVGRGS